MFVSIFAAFHSIAEAVTHNGPFHADDVFAGALARLLNPDVRITRTRDPEVMEKADIVFDVGGIYDPLKGRFDHHQKGGAKNWDDGLPMSSFGLLWYKLGLTACDNDEDAYSRVLETLVKPIDAVDNGIELATPIPGHPRSIDLWNVLHVFQPAWYEDQQDHDKGYEEAVEFAQQILSRAIEDAKQYAQACREIDQGAADSLLKNVIVLERFVPWQEHVVENHLGALFVVFPDLKNGWRIQVIPRKLGEFGARKDLPAEWAGLRDADLDTVTGVPGGIFCHNGRFIAGHKTREGVLELAKLALEA